MTSKTEYFDSVALTRDTWKRKNRYYYIKVEELYASLIPSGKSVLEIGCGTGDLLAAVKPERGLGIDVSPEMVSIAQSKYPQYTFVVGDAERLPLVGSFEYIIMDCLLGHLDDIWVAFQELKKVSRPDTRIVITYYNFLWEPILQLGEALGLKMPQKRQNWFPLGDIENLLSLTDFEIETTDSCLLLPKRIPLISHWVNNSVANSSFFKKACLLQYIVARPKEIFAPRREFTCSVIIPCRNEVGNIEGCVQRTPLMGKHTEIIFVDGDSSDGTREKIGEAIERYRGEKDIKLILQVPPSASDGDGEVSQRPNEMLPLGKGDAVRKGFEAASGDILMILDADLTVPPEDLRKFYLPLVEGKAEFVNGSRLVYPLEDQAMRTLNLFGNKVFSLIFTWLLGQRVRDTLCGTKVLFKKDYERIKEGRSYFGDFDPFGDFDLLFGAARLGLKIVEMPVRYRRRVAGYSKVSAFKHGWLLLKMCVFGFRRFKLPLWKQRLLQVGKKVGLMAFD